MWYSVVLTCYQVSIYQPHVGSDADEKNVLEPGGGGASL